MWQPHIDFRRLPEAVGSATQPVIAVNPGACLRVAKMLRQVSVPAEEEEFVLPPFATEELSNFFLWLVAVCHQTSPHGRAPLEGIVKGRLKRGWDYLAAKFAERSAVCPSLLKPQRWVSMEGAEFRDLFQDAQSPIHDPEGRAALIRNLGATMLEQGWTSLDGIYRMCDGRIATTQPNLLSELRNFKAYADPLQKKSFFLLALMRNCGVWKFRDAESIGPPVDYHEVRGHLRLGTVSVQNEALRRKLLLRMPVSAEENMDVRTAVLEAILLISEESKVDSSRLHYLFWNVFRSCCPALRPHCKSCPANCSLPERYTPLAELDGLRHCPFLGVCDSANSTEKYFEPVIETDFY